MAAMTPLGNKRAQIFFENLKFQGAWCYTGHVVNFNLQSPWCYSGQDVGVIKRQNVSVIVNPPPCHS